MTLSLNQKLFNYRLAPQLSNYSIGIRAGMGREKSSVKYGERSNEARTN